MNKYVQVSCDVYDMIEKATMKKVECVITYLKGTQEKATVKSQIVDLRNVNNSEFIETADGSVIRLDRIVAFNGEKTSNINHYL